MLQYFIDVNNVDVLLLTDIFQEQVLIKKTYSPANGLI